MECSAMWSCFLSTHNVVFVCFLMLNKLTAVPKQCQTPHNYSITSLKGFETVYMHLDVLTKIISTEVGYFNTEFLIACSYLTNCH